MMSDGEKTAYGIAAIALVVPALLWKAYVVSVLWGWFIAPVLSVPPLGVGQAMGVCLFATCFQRTPPKRPDSEDKAAAFARFTGIAFAMPLLTLCIGWIVKAFM